MSDKNEKILLLNYHSEATEQAKKIFQEFRVTTAESLEDVSEKINEGFDIILTGYVVPAASRDTSFSYLKDITTALSNLKSEIKETETVNFIENEYLKKQEQILQLLNERIKNHEKEKMENELMIQDMQRKTDAALEFQKNAQKKIEQFTIIMKDSQMRAEDAEEKLQKLESENETLKKKLKKLQDNWENYIA